MADDQLHPVAAGEKTRSDKGRTLVFGMGGGVGPHRRRHRLLRRTALALSQPRPDGLPHRGLSGPPVLPALQLRGRPSRRPRRAGSRPWPIFNAWQSPIVPLHDVTLAGWGGRDCAIGLTVLLNHLCGRAIHPRRRPPCSWPSAPSTPPGVRALIVIGVVLLVVLGELGRRLFGRTPGRHLRRIDGGINVEDEGRVTTARAATARRAAI